jgi:hypothetical protein
MSKNVTLVLFALTFVGGNFIRVFVHELIGEWIVWCGGAAVIFVSLFNSWKDEKRVYFWIFFILLLAWMIGFSFYIF